MLAYRLALKSAVTLVLFAWATVAVATAQTRDAARLLPPETCVYVGWSELLGEEGGWMDVARGVAVALAAEEGEDAKQAAGQACDLARIALRNPGGIGLMHLPSDGFPLQAALVVTAGDDAPRLATGFYDLLRLGGAAEHVEQTTVQNVELRMLDIDAPQPLVWGAHQGHFLAAFGREAAAAVLARIDESGAPLAEQEEFRFCRQKVNAAESGRTLAAFINVPQFIVAMKSLVPPGGPQSVPVDDLLATLGVSSLRGLRLQADEGPQGPRCQVFLHTAGAATGVLRLWQQAPLTDDDLKLIPQDAYWATAFNIDLAAVWHELRAVLEKLAPDALEELDEELTSATTPLGFSPVQDLLPALGDTWVLYDRPEHGGFLITGIVLGLEVRDAAKVQSILERVINVLKQPLAREDVRLELRQAERNGHQVHYVMVGGVPCPVAPAWGFAGDRWIFGLYPQTVALALDQATPAKRQSSLLDDAEVKSLRAALPPDSIAFSYANGEYVWREIYPLVLLVRTIGESWGMRAGAGDDLAAFPTLPEQLEGVTAIVRTCTRDDDGILYTQVGRGPLVMMGANESGLAMAISILLPSLSRARLQAKRAVSMANLRGIGQGCYIYANDNAEKFPESLDVLIDNGYITEKMLYSPLLGAASRSYTYIAGQTAAADLRNVLAYEWPPSDRKTAALFCDGHVELMPLEQFAEALKATYQRLNRQDEMPDLELERWMK